MPDAPEKLFDDFARTPVEHYRLHFFGAVVVCLEHAVSVAESFDAVLEKFPFLIGYNNEIANRLPGLSPREAFQHWCAALEAWERRATQPLPLVVLRSLVGGGTAGAMCLLTAGLVEEDARFGALFEFLQGNSGQRRPTAGFLRQCWGHYLEAPEFSRIHRHARQLGLWQIAGTDATQLDQQLLIPPTMWEVLRGDPETTPLAWARYREPDSLMKLEELVVSTDTKAALAALPALFARGEVRVLVLRGAHRNGRHTLLGAFARSLGRGLLELRGTGKIDEARWAEVVALAQLRHALPVATFDLGPGEILVLPEDWPPDLPLGIVLGREGGLTGDLAGEALTITLELPDPAARRVHWNRALSLASGAELAEITTRYRISAGQIHRAARIARMHAALAERTRPAATDVLSALRTLNRQMLDALARRVPVDGDWSRLCASPVTFRELEHLERRCRHRELLPAVAAGSAGVGVRALFTGPSGTGKTHAARLLAAVLNKDLYQLDLSAVVNKYIGETEKNLNRVLQAAEELDVILLLDEGDALLTQRTDVQSSTDRYANLETNFLLQRIENYLGILIVTTNARSRIDPAFERRMDVTVEFHPPDPDERWALWQLHLPTPHAVNQAFLGEIVMRCDFTGGQIRNAALHATLLALDGNGVVTNAALEAAVRREYAKQGGTCPLRHFAGTH